MSFYRRFISYMYDSHQKQHSKNCGFVKIEIRNNRCLIFFHLDNAPCRSKCNAYLCFRNADSNYLFLHSIPIQNGTTQFKLELTTESINNSNLPFSQACGILCTDETDNNCYTCWDSLGILPHYTSISQNEKISSATQTLQIEDTPSITHDSHTEASSITHPHEEYTLSPPQDQHADHTIPESHFTKTESIPRPSHKKQPFSELWAHMQKEFTAMDPFEDHAIVESIKVAPSDLEFMKENHVDLGANQFLLHGYKCYHHLLLGRIHGQLQYILGVPGIYDPQEQFMAKMFGFPCFKPIRESMQKNGQFGYWLRCFR